MEICDFAGYQNKSVSTIDEILNMTIHAERTFKCSQP